MRDILGEGEGGREGGGTAGNLFRRLMSSSSFMGHPHSCSMLCTLQRAAEPVLVFSSMLRALLISS